jgi:small subunit ribosomal protein S7
MSRRKIAKKRVITQDPVYNSKLVNMLLARLLQDGKKSIASKIFYTAMDSIQKTTLVENAGPNQNELGKPSAALQIFQQAVLHVTPAVEVKSRRIGGANFQVPIEVNAERGTSLALRWLVQAARQRAGREMSTKLANEILDASNKVGGAVKKKEESLRMAEANRAYASYRF